MLVLFSFFVFRDRHLESKTMHIYKSLITHTSMSKPLQIENANNARNESIFI